MDLVKVGKFCELSGFTEDAVRGKIKRGDWIENGVYVRAPDGTILISLEGYELWARKQHSALAARALERMASCEKAGRASRRAPSASPRAVHGPAAFEGVRARRGL